MQPQPIDRYFFMSIARQLYRQNPDAKARREEYDKGFLEGKKEGIEATERQAGEAGDLIRQVREFQEASGLDITTDWNVAGLGKAVKVVRDREKLEYFIGELKHLDKSHRKLCDAAKAALQIMEEFQKLRSEVT